jgi:hypothetical protein
MHSAFAYAAMSHILIEALVLILLILAR